MESHWPSSSKPPAQVGCGLEAKGLLVVSNHSAGLAMGLACTTVHDLLYLFLNATNIHVRKQISHHLGHNFDYPFGPAVYDTLQSHGLCLWFITAQTCLVWWPNHPTNRVFLIEVWTWIIVTFCSLVPNHTDSLGRVVHSLRLLLLLNCYYILVVAYPWWLINEMFVSC